MAVSANRKMEHKCLSELGCVDAELHLSCFEFFLKLFSLVGQHPGALHLDSPREPAC